MKTPLFLDVETTGTEEQDRLCQLAYMYKDESFEELFKPPLPISFEAMAITHITNKTVLNSVPFKEHPISVELQKYFNADAVFVAHNAAFDMAFLLKEDMTLPKEFVCTMKLAHDFDKKGELTKHTLQYLRYYYGLEFDEPINPHDAMSDVIVLKKLYEFYLQHYTIDQMIKISSRPILLKKMPFGKYAKIAFSEIARIDLDYMQWMRRSMDMDENMRYTVEHWLEKFGVIKR